MSHDRVSAAFRELINLSNAAKDHHNGCLEAPGRHESCTVSLYLLRLTAERLLPKVNADEYSTARDLVQDWPV